MEKIDENQLNATIRKAGFRATKTRKFVLSLLQEAKYPLSIKDIVEKIGKQNINQVTAYRIINAFKTAGLVKEIDFRHGYAYYEINDHDKNHHHHHIVCVNCEKVEDFTGCNFESLEDKILKQTKEFRHITNHSLEFFGLCHACAEKENL